MNKIIKFLKGLILSILYIKSDKDYNKIILRADSENMMFNTKYFFEFLKEKTDYKLKYIINNTREREKLKEIYGDYFIGDKKIKEIIEILKAGIWITDGSFPVKSPFGHKKRVLINFFHGIPLKKIGIEGYNGLNKYRMILFLKFFSKYYSAFCVTSENLKDIISKSFCLNKSKIKVLGQPRNDALFNDEKNALRKINEMFSLPEFKKLILYAPTWRKGIYGNSLDKKTTFFPFKDFKNNELEIFLNENKFIIFLRPHHLEKLNLEESERVKVLDSNKLKDIMEVINCFDLLITDYSSIYFDFLIVEKPILFLPYDLEEYERIVKLNFKYNEVTPGPKSQNFNEFKKDIEKLLYDNNFYKQERKKVNDFFNEVKKNNCERILNFLKKEIERKKLK